MIGLLDRAVRGFLLLLVTLMILTVVWQVVSRYALRAPSSVTEEVARFQLIWLGTFGAVYTFRNRMHVGIDMLTAGLSGRRRLGADLFSLAACFVFSAAVLVYGGARLVWLTDTLDQRAAALAIPVSWVYAILPVSGLLICVYAAHFAREALRGHDAAPPPAADMPPGLARGPGGPGGQGGEGRS